MLPYIQGEWVILDIKSTDSLDSSVVSYSELTTASAQEAPEDNEDNEDNEEADLPFADASKVYDDDEYEVRDLQGNIAVVKSTMKSDGQKQAEEDQVRGTFQADPRLRVLQRRAMMRSRPLRLGQ